LRNDKNSHHFYILLYIRGSFSIVVQAIPTSSTPTVAKPSPRQTIRTASSANPTQKEYGRPVADDHIRYDLLVKN
jgi:hypothetical protein